MPIEFTKKILIIDDDPAFRAAAVEALKGHLPEGVEVIAPATMEEALRQEVLEDVIIALIDKSLNGHGYQEGNFRGWQVAIYLREHFPAIYLICFSRANFGEMEGRVQDFFLAKLGFLDVDKKEATAEALRAVIKKAIEIVSVRA